MLSKSNIYTFAGTLMAGVVATVVASGGVAGYIATVESTAAFLGTAATFVPWL